MLLHFGCLGVFLVYGYNLRVNDTRTRWIATSLASLNARLSQQWLVQLFAALQERLLDELLHVRGQLDQVRVGGGIIAAALLGGLNWLL